jgi:hypothetical protein
MRGDRTSTWWSDRWAWRGAFALAPLGALGAILHALLVERASVGDALLAYALGAMVAAGIGCVLGGPLGAFCVAFRARFRPADEADEAAPAEPAAALPDDEAREAQPTPAPGRGQLALELDVPADPYPDLASPAARSRERAPA